MEEELTIYVSEKDLEEFPETDLEEDNIVRVRKGTITKHYCSRNREKGRNTDYT